MKPIAITKVQWLNFTDIFGPAPSKALDASAIDVTDHMSPLASLGGPNGLQNLRNMGPFYNHFFITFAGEFDNEEILFKLATKLQIYVEKRKKTWLALISGSAIQWIDMVVRFSSKDQDTDIRLIANTVQTHLEQTVMREVFKGWPKIALYDGTFYL